MAQTIPRMLPERAQTGAWLLILPLAAGLSLAILSGSGYLQLAAVAIVVAFFLVWLTTPAMVLTLTFVLINNPLSVLLVSRFLNNVFVASGLCLTAIAVLIHRSPRNGTAIPRTILDRPFLAFCFLLLLYTLFGLYQGNYFLLVLEDLFPFACFFSAFWLSKMALREIGQIRRLLLAVWIASLTRALYEVYLYIFPPSRGIDPATSGLLMDMDILGVGVPRIMDFMVLVALIPVVSILVSDVALSLRARLFLWCSAGLFSFLVVLTFFRSVWAGTLAAFAYLFLAVGKGARTRLAIYVGAILVCIGLTAFFAQNVFSYRGIGFSDALIERTRFTLDQLADPGISDMAARRMELVSVLRAVSESKFMGIGLGGTFAKDFYTRYDIAYPEKDVPQGRQHGVFSFYLAVLLYMGLPGFCLLSYLIFLALREFRRIAAKLRPGLWRGCAMGLSASAVGYGVVLSTFAALYAFPIGIYLGTMTAMIFVLDHLERLRLSGLGQAILPEKIRSARLFSSAGEPPRGVVVDGEADCHRLRGRPPMPSR